MGEGQTPGAFILRNKWSLNRSRDSVNSKALHFLRFHESGHTVWERELRKGFDWVFLCLGEESKVQEGGKMGVGSGKERNFIPGWAAPERHLEIGKCLTKAC